MKTYHVELNSGSTPPVNNRFIIDLQGRFSEIVGKPATFTYTTFIIQTNGSLDDSYEDLTNFPLLAIRSNLPATCASKSDGSPYTAIVYLDPNNAHTFGAETFIYSSNQANNTAVETVIPSYLEIFLTTDMQGNAAHNLGGNRIILNLAIQVAE